MTVAWHSELPDYLASIESEDDPSVYWTELPKGAPKVRGEVTRTVKRMRVTMQLTMAQVPILEDYFRVSLQKGAMDFTFPDPYHGTMKYFMREPPKIVSDSPVTALASMLWIQLEPGIQSLPLPFTVTALAGDEEVTLNWTESYYADTYRVWLDDVPYGSILPDTARTLIVTGLVNNVGVNLRVVASNVTGDRSSNEVNVTPKTPIVPGICTFTATAGNKKVTIALTAAASDAGYYELRVGTELPGTLVATLLPNGFPYVDDNLTPGVQRSYWLIAFNANGSTNSSSNPRLATPLDLEPGAFTYHCVADNGAVQFHIDSASSLADDYVIRQGTTEPGQIVATVPAANFPWSDTGLPVAERMYWVYATNEEGTRASSSNPVTITPLEMLKPTAPQFAVRGLDSAIEVTITAHADDANEYIVKFGDVENLATEVARFSASLSSTVITGLANGTPQTVWVYAENEVGITAASNNSQQVTPIASTPPPGAFSFTLTPGNGKLTVTLSPASVGATHYNIYHGTWGQPSWTKVNGDITTFPYDITGLTNEQDYPVWVSAFNFGGMQVTQASGNPKVGTPTAGIPGQFSFNAVAAAGKVTISLQSPASNAVSYKVKRDNVQVCDGALPWDDTGATLNVEHSYTCFAVNANGERAATNNPRLATPWSAGLSYPANTHSWDAADASKMTKFSGVQALDKWESKNSAAVYFDGNASGDACVHTAGTNSVDAAASPQRYLTAIGLSVAPPFTFSFLAWYPPDCPASGIAMELSSNGARIQFRKSGTDAVTWIGPNGLYANYGAASGSLSGTWVLVTGICAADKRSATLRINGVERATDTTTADIVAIAAARINITGQGDAATNTKIKRQAFVGQALSGQALLDFEDCVLNGEGGAPPDPPPDDEEITESHQSVLTWLDPRKTWASLGTGKYQTHARTGYPEDPATWPEPGAINAGVDRLIRVTSPCPSYKHQIVSSQPAWDGKTFRSSIGTQNVPMTLRFGTKYIECFAFRFPSAALTTANPSVCLQEHHVSVPDFNAPGGGAYGTDNGWMSQSGWQVFHRTATGKLSLETRYSIDGIKKNTTPGGANSINAPAADQWIYFVHAFRETCDLSIGPYDKVWVAYGNGALTKVLDIANRNCRGQPTGTFGYTFASMNLYAWQPFSGVAGRMHYSLGIHTFKDEGLITPEMLLKFMRSITG